MRLTKPLLKPFVTSRDVDDGLGMVLPSNQAYESTSRVPFISDDVVGLESTIGNSGLSEEARSLFSVMDIPRGDIGSYRQLIFRVYHEVQLVAIHELVNSLCSFLNRPSRLWVRLPRFTTVRPCLKRGAVHRYSLPKPRQSVVGVPHQRTGHILHQMQVFPFRQLSEESRERSFVGIAPGYSMPHAGLQAIVKEFLYVKEQLGKPGDYYCSCHTSYVT